MMDDTTRLKRVEENLEFQIDECEKLRMQLDGKEEALQSTLAFIRQLRSQ